MNRGSYFSVGNVISLMRLWSTAERKTRCTWLTITWHTDSAPLVFMGTWQMDSPRIFGGLSTPSGERCSQSYTLTLLEGCFLSLYGWCFNSQSAERHICVDTASLLWLVELCTCLQINAHTVITIQNNYSRLVFYRFTLIRYSSVAPKLSRATSCQQTGLGFFFFIF